MFKFEADSESTLKDSFQKTLDRFYSHSPFASLVHTNFDPIFAHLVLENEWRSDEPSRDLTPYINNRVIHIQVTNKGVVVIKEYTKNTFLPLPKYSKFNVTIY